MSSSLNKILYNYDIFATSESISILEPYMVGNSVILPTNTIILEQEPMIQNNSSIKTERTDKFFPKQDSLFWSVFIAHYGLKEFYNVYSYHNREIEEKFKIMEYLKSLSKIDIQITKCSTQEMMGELMVAKNTSLFIMNALCIYYKMNFIIVYKNTYLEFNLKKILTKYENEIHTGIIYKNETPGTKNKYSVDLYVTSEKIQIIQDTKIRLETSDRPLRGISVYKITDLEMMLRKLEPNLGENLKLNKRELYESVYKNCLGFSTI